MRGLFSAFFACWWGSHAIYQIIYLTGTVETGITPITGLCACLLATLFFIEQTMRS